MASTKIKPRLSYTLLCDDVRQELGGKFSLMSVRFNTTFNAPGTYWIETLLDGERISLTPLPLQLVSDKTIH
jgi:hypothetical protein